MEQTLPPPHILNNPFSNLPVLWAADTGECKVTLYACAGEELHSCPFYILAHDNKVEFHGVANIKNIAGWINIVFTLLEQYTNFSKQIRSGEPIEIPNGSTLQ